MNTASKRIAVLYIFGGEKAQGAEIVIERLIDCCAQQFDIHLILSPGVYADSLLKADKPYQISTLTDLKKLNRTFASKLNFYSRAISNYFSLSYKVGRYIRRHGISVVHCNTLVPAAYVTPLILWSKLFMPKVKWLWSDHDMKYFSKLENGLANWCLRLYNHTLVVSAALKKKYKTASGKLTVLYNGLDPAEFKSDHGLRKAFRAQYGFADDDLLVGIAGSINPDKGQLELIEAFKKLSVNTNSVKLIIAGGFAAQFPAYIEVVKNAIEANANISFIGFITDTCKFYNGCDIIVNNSNNGRSESLGTTIYEAMACEKVVVASATGGTPEIITHNLEGFLFETENQDALLEQLSYALKHHGSLDSMRQAARQKVLNRFNIATMSATYSRLLNAL